MLINLVKNAIKFTTIGDKIEIKVNYNYRKQLLKVHVKDSGVGIAQEDMTKLFTRFGKLHRTAEMNSEGMGLGLIIVKQIVEQSGGTIFVQSDGLGHGSLFCFTMKLLQVEGEMEQILQDKELGPETNEHGDSSRESSSI